MDGDCWSGSSRRRDPIGSALVRTFGRCVSGRRRLPSDLRQTALLGRSPRPDSSTDGLPPRVSARPQRSTGRSPDAPPTGDDQSAVPPLFRGGYRLTRLVDLHHDTVITDREVDLPALQRLQLIHEVFRDRDHLSILGRPDGFSDHHHSGTVRLGDLEHHSREMPRTDRQLVVIRTGESVGICHLVPSRLALFRTYPAATRCGAPAQILSAFLASRSYGMRIASRSSRCQPTEAGQSAGRACLSSHGRHPAVRLSLGLMAARSSKLDLVHLVRLPTYLAPLIERAATLDRLTPISLGYGTKRRSNGRRAACCSSLRPRRGFSARSSTCPGSMPRRSGSYLRSSRADSQPSRSRSSTDPIQRIVQSSPRE